MPGMGGTDTGGNAFLDRAYGLRGAQEARALYDEWAETYDADLTGDEQGYVGPERAAATVARVAGVDGAILDAAYDTVVCVGTFTHGHVGPEGFAELVRVLRPGGVFVATVLDDIWSAGGYEAETVALAGRGVVDVVSTDVVDYRSGLSVDARMVVLRRR
jgi:SAM-dependent methyltransferase